MKIPRFALFVLAGGMAALANFGSRFAFDVVMPYVPAIILAYCVGMATAFLLNRVFVFTGATSPVHQQAAWFVLINLGAVVQTILVSLLFAKWIFPTVGMSWYPEAVAHAIGVIVPVVTSYVGHKRWTFR